MDKFFESKFFTALSIFLVAVLGFMIFRSRPAEELLNEDIKNRESRIAELQRKTEQLRSEFIYFESESYLEKQARLKLGLKKPGENVVYIVRDEKETASESENFEKDFWGKLMDKIFTRD